MMNHEQFKGSWDQLKGALKNKWEKLTDDDLLQIEGDLDKFNGNKSDGGFCLSHQAFLRLRDLGQQEALQEPDLGAYWPKGATPREPSLNRCGVLIPRDDEKLVQVVEELGAEANGHCAELK